MRNRDKLERGRVSAYLERLVAADDGVVMTRGRYVEQLVKRGGVLFRGRFKSQLFNRRHYNRLDSARQDAYLRKINSTLMPFAVQTPDGAHRALTKTEADHFLAIGGIDGDAP